MRKDPELYRIAILMLTALGEEPEIIHGEAKSPAKKAGHKTSRSRKKGKPETA